MTRHQGHAMSNEDRTALVTGANSGLGLEAAAQLAEEGWGTVILACRTVEKAETAPSRSPISPRATPRLFQAGW